MSSTRSFHVLVACFVALLVAGVSFSAAPSRTISYEHAARPFFAKYYLDCREGQIGQRSARKRAMDRRRRRLLSISLYRSLL